MDIGNGKRQIYTFYKHLLHQSNNILKHICQLFSITNSYIIKYTIGYKISVKNMKIDCSGFIIIQLVII